LFGSRTTFLPLAVLLMGLFLHRDHLWGWLWFGLPVVGIWVLPQLPMKDGQLFIELAPGFRELVKPRPSLGVGGMVTWRWFRIRAA
jgi:hypothetical protein